MMIYRFRDNRARGNPDAPRASDQLRAAYQAAVLDKTTT
jgi:hypothetical protein